MGKRSAGVAVLTLLVLAAALASFVVWQTEQQLARLASSHQSLDDQFARLQSAAVEIGAAQQSYVAPGQLDQAWLERTAELFEQVRGWIGDLSPSLHAERDDTTRALTGTVDLLVETDTRARQNLELGEELMAADVIYSDGRNIIGTLMAQLENTQRAEQDWYDAETRALARRRWLAVGSAAGLWLAGLIALTLARERRHVAPAQAAAPAPETPPVAGELPAFMPVQPPPSVDLSTVAAVCQELAVVADAPALINLLGCATGFVNSAGVVLWVAQGEHLFASVSYGYPQDHVARFGSIVRDADNAVARAWRTRSVSIVPGDRFNDGALVVPVIGMEGCAGVLAFETRYGAEQDAQVQALATIVAAQVAAAPLSWPSPAAQEPEVPPANVRSA